MTESLTPHQSRALGALLGVHTGDSLGATFEFRSHGQILQYYPDGLREIVGGGIFDWPPGHATDDTDMTRAVLLAYLDCRQQQREIKEENKTGQADGRIVHLAASRFLEWFTGDPWPDRSPNSHPVDVGGATYTGLAKYKSTRNPFSSGTGRGSAGNGSLMRCIPTALFESDPDARLRDSILISAITHDDPRCTVACAAYNAMVAELVNGSPPEKAIRVAEDTIEVVKKSCAESPGEDHIIVGANQVLAAIELARTISIAETAQSGPPPSMPGKCRGYVLETLTLAVAAIMDPRSFEDVLVDIVRIGRDSDTNGAVAGGLLGARDGVEGIPQRWRETLQFGKEFQELTLKLL